MVSWLRRQQTSDERPRPMYGEANDTKAFGMFEAQMPNPCKAIPLLDPAPMHRK